MVDFMLTPGLQVRTNESYTSTCSDRAIPLVRVNGVLISANYFHSCAIIGSYSQTETWILFYSQARNHQADIENTLGRYIYTPFVFCGTPFLYFFGYLYFAIF